MEKAITKFRGEHAFLSNFFGAEIRIGNNTYSTNEHAFHAAKCVDPAQHVLILNAKSPAEAKSIGKEVTLKPNWLEIQDEIMFFINMVKYTTHFDLKQKLLATGSRELVEGNWWGDTYWGVCNGAGENRLGKILMRIRYIMGGAIGE